MVLVIPYLGAIIYWIVRKPTQAEVDQAILKNADSQCAADHGRFTPAGRGQLIRERVGSPSSCRRTRRTAKYAALIVVGVVLCAVTAVVTATGTASDPVWLEAFARALTVAVPLAVGIYALRRPPFARFGALLLLTGFVWFLTTLTNSDSEVALQHRPGLGMAGGAAAALSAAGVPDRPARGARRPRAGRAPSVALRRSSTCRPRCWSSTTRCRGRG